MQRGSSASLRVAAAAVGEPTRYTLLEFLGGAPRTVGELVSLLGIRQPLVSHHLGILRRAGLVRVVREGKNRSYSIASHSDPGVQGLLDLVCAAGSAGRDARMTRERVPSPNSQGHAPGGRNLPLEDFLL